VTDDERGFDVPENPAEFAPEGHYGLLGMHERAELVGAQLNIRSSPGEGTRLIVSIPHSNMGKPALDNITTSS
jgi:two-component system NarL family sensor kinase